MPWKDIQEPDDKGKNQKRILTCKYSIQWNIFSVNKTKINELEKTFLFPEVIWTSLQKWQTLSQLGECQAKWTALCCKEVNDLRWRCVAEHAWVQPPNYHTNNGKKKSPHSPQTLCTYGKHRVRERWRKKHGQLHRTGRETTYKGQAERDLRVTQNVTSSVKWINMSVTRVTWADKPT